MVKLPKSYVLPIQGILWSDHQCIILQNVATTRRRISPSKLQPIAQIAPQNKSEPRNSGAVLLTLKQIFFNLFPALVGPLLTQLLVDAAGVEHIWGTHLVTLYVWLMAAGCSIPKVDVKAWRAQRDRQATIFEDSNRTGIALTKEQMQVVRQPDHSENRVDKTI
ncbi:hypothetical protein K432DRAFT_410794 [Lepidopterella palustris CBS 459.81]|uniref:Uncharacterized protein n=1 Tax=Lepidopterella palustris CBS 459.81 TaxID=1314670 RepID=A0A8E2DX26_9PEZI|nr:hypothetical protein K432DRAFT_410794 [Lepidopterella palustris CBS 459.81]